MDHKKLIGIQLKLMIKKQCKKNPEIDATTAAIQKLIGAPMNASILKLFQRDVHSDSRFYFLL
jgi:hypothetical protein